jgi:hypothetical protein
MTSLGFFRNWNYDAYIEGRLMFSLFVLLILMTAILTSYQNAFAVATNSVSNATSIATSVTQNLLTVVALLLGTSSFILGLSIQNSSRLTSTMNKYFRVLILAMVLPSVVIIIYGIVLVGSTLDAGDVHYLLLLFSLFVPAGAILFLLSRLHTSVPDAENKSNY